MDALLFLGVEYLVKMTDTHLTTDARETYGEALAAYSRSDAGFDITLRLVQAFNGVTDSDVLRISVDVWLWYLDWVFTQERSVVDEVDANLLNRVWFNIPDALLRSRVVASMLQLDSSRGTDATEAATVRVQLHYSAMMAEGTIDEAGRSSVFLLLDILLTEALLFRGSSYVTRVLRRCLSVQPEDLRNESLSHIDEQLQQLSDSEAEALRREIWPLEP